MMTNVGSRIFTGLAVAGLFSSFVSVAQARVESGLLTCEVSGGFALIISSPRELHCVFQKTNGQSEAYAGSIREFGLDIGVTGAGVIAWNVVAETTEVPPGVLAGNYSGVEAGAAVVVGAEGRALVGGSRRTITLQPLSVEGHVGLNVAIGIASMELYPLFRRTSAPAQVRVPAVGHDYGTVPYAEQAPHYGCGSYTHLMRGQTLSGLAHACGVSFDALLEANPQITDVRNISAGALIHLPARVNRRAGSACGRRVVVHEDESLEHLAWRCGVTLHALLQANPSVRDVSMLRPGLVLRIPAASQRSSAPVSYAKTEADVAPSQPEKQVTNSDAGRGPASGIRREQVRFRSGQTGASITGRIVGYESVSYLVSAEAGQTMTIALRPSNLATYFNVYEPGKGPGDQALASGSTTGPMTPDLNRFRSSLRTSGTYTISVFMMRAAARRNERSNYTLDVSVSALSDARRPVQDDYADGLEGGPDYWDVRTSGGAATVAVRVAPSAAGGRVGNLNNGTVLRNLGCRMAEGRRWCHVETLSAPRVSGWVSGDALRESAFAGPQPQSGKPAASGARGNFDRPVGGVRPKGSGFTATGQIACARSTDQPMSQCDFGIVRQGGGRGMLTLFWPDGGTRVIFFENGAPAYFDHSQADGNVRMSVKRNADLFFVVIGQQRFEIPEIAITGG